MGQGSAVDVATRYGPPPPKRRYPYTILHGVITDYVCFNNIWKEIICDSGQRINNVIQYITRWFVAALVDLEYGHISADPSDRAVLKRGSAADRLQGSRVRIVPSRIPDDWLLRPDFTLWPSKRHRAVLWLLAHYLCFRTRQDGGLTILDYFDFLRRCRWKLYRGKKRFEQVGNYLCTLDM